MALSHSTFEYLKPTEKQLHEMATVREAARVYANILEVVLPEGPDKTWCLRHHRTTAMWANIAITRLSDGSPRIDTP